MCARSPRQQRRRRRTSTNKYGFQTVATKPKYYHSNNEDAYEMRLNLDHRYYRAHFEERFARLIERHDLVDQYTDAAPPRKLGQNR